MVKTAMMMTHDLYCLFIEDTNTILGLECWTAELETGLKSMEPRLNKGWFDCDSPQQEAAQLDSRIRIEF